MSISEAQKNRMFKGIYDGKISAKNLPKAYYNDFADRLDSKIKKGFGVRKVTDKTKMLTPITEMSENARLFAGAKTYHLTRELQEAKKGAKNYKEYKERAQKIYDKYETWGVAEENTMMASAQSCKKWNQIEEDKDLFPKLRYSTIGDACVICAPLDGVIALVGDPIWAKVAPTNHYNCMCLLEQETSSVRSTNKSKIQALSDHLDSVMDDTFKNNVGVTNEAFPRHPYFEVAKKDIPLARKNFNLPIPDIRNSLDLDINYEPISIRSIA